MRSWKDYQSYEDLLPNHVFIQRVAQAAGVSTQSVNRAAKKRFKEYGKRDRKRLRGCPYTFVSLSLWDFYMQVGSIQRSATKPQGWLTVKALANEGLSRRRIYQLIKSGNLKAVYVGNILYVEPMEAQRYIQERSNHRAPPGWLLVSDVQTKAGRSKQALAAYIKRNKLDIRYFLHPSRDQLVRHIRAKDAETYLNQAQKSNKHTPKCFRESAAEEKPSQVSIPVPVVETEPEVLITKSVPLKPKKSRSPVKTVRNNRPVSAQLPVFPAPPPSVDGLFHPPLKW